LGIIAGSGDLPLAIAEAAEADGRNVFVIALEGMANEDHVIRFPHGTASPGELGKMLRLLRDAGCSEVTLAGRVPRPEFTSLKLDARGALALPKVIAAAARGDDALLRALVDIFEREGFKVIGSADAARDLLAPLGPLGLLEPSEQDMADIAYAQQVVAATGALDIGQAAIVCDGLVLAVEAAEGTDAMIQRIGTLSEAVRGTPEVRRGVLVKAPKPGQDRRVDLPVIGKRTVELASEVGLSGIATEAGSTLILNRRVVSEVADALGRLSTAFRPRKPNDGRPRRGAAPHHHVGCRRTVGRSVGSAVDAGACYARRA
jgi:DUF1009 family protein